MSLITDDIRRELSAMYSSPDRFYHGLSHVEALLALLERHRAAFTDPTAVEAAIWFHDCIYDSKAKDNEHRSAEQAVARLRDSVDAVRLARIRDMIEATAAHVPPPIEDPAELADVEMFLDMDLSILGAGQAAFDAYEAAVRQEYRWVEDDGWRAGRGDVLRRFLARPRIFYSDLFRDLYEDAARRNMERSIERLGGEVLAQPGERGADVSAVAGPGSVVGSESTGG